MFLLLRQLEKLVDEKKAGILKFMPTTFVNNDNHAVRVIHQEKGKGKNQKRELQHKMQLPCPNSCKKKCYSKFTEEERQTFFDSYWKLSDSHKLFMTKRENGNVERLLRIEIDSQE